jgi:hypothetical protein
MQTIIKHKIAWSALRSAVVADDTLLSTYEYANAVYVARRWEVPAEFDSIVIAAYGKAAENKDLIYTLHGRRAQRGPIEILAAGVMTLGARLVTTDPITGAVVTAYWVDTITNTAEWIKTPVIKNSGADGICYLCMDLAGISDVDLQVDLDGGDDAMTEFSAIIAGMQA